MHIIRTTAELRIVATRLNSHYFSADTLRFFSSRVHSTVYGGRYFVTSEQMRGAYISSGWIPAEPRRYSVREFTITTRARNTDGRIIDEINFGTVGEFQQYETREQAHAAARAAARAQFEWNAWQLDEAQAAAVECLLWSSVVPIDEQGTMVEASNTGANLSDQAHEQLRQDVRNFVQLVKDAGIPTWGGLEPAQVGHDFILTRNGHGAGFWDRGLGELGEELSKWARTMGSAELYLGASGELEIL